MDKKLLCSLLLAAAFIGQAQTAQAATVSKMPGTKNMGIYAKVTKKGASKKVTTTKYFKYSKIQSTASKKTKKGTYAYIYANGRPLGWVSEKWFVETRFPRPSKSTWSKMTTALTTRTPSAKIGRASCRERVFRAV